MLVKLIFLLYVLIHSGVDYESSIQSRVDY